VVRRWLEHEGRERDICAACCAIHYRNPRVIVGCLVCHGDRILLGRRAHEPARGCWAIPAGFLEWGETLEEGAARETFEETGVMVDPARIELAAVMNIVDVGQVHITFRVHLDVLRPTKAGPECLEVAFMSEEELSKAPFAWREDMGEGPKLLFAELRASTPSIRLITTASRRDKVLKMRRYELGRIENEAS
jgi:ADP-ribose pyrophosphatase YjhB (NUDIX family)